ncbi:MAG: RIP metalloprotease RseP [Clostridiaceae bacterium]|nr:RIP metalloprotease RseP [Clostridiaceae bacterium]
MSLLGILIGLVIIGLMMLVHESGHFFAGRLLNFKILEFSIFMGPRLITTEKNGVKYSFRLLPIGASVQFAGEYSEDDDEIDDKNDPGLFFNRPRWARAIVVFSGPLANFITAFLAFVIMFSAFGVAVPRLAAPIENTLIYKTNIAEGDRLISYNNKKIRTSADFAIAKAFSDPTEPINIVIEKSDQSQHEIRLEPQTTEQYRLGVVQNIETNTIIEVDPESNQGKPVLQEGDQIISINGIDYSASKEITDEINRAKNNPIVVKVKRDQEVLELSMRPTYYQDQLADGIFFTEGNSVVDVLYQAWHYPWSIVKSTIEGFALIFQGQMKFSDSVTGPVGIVKVFGDVVQDSPDIGIMIYQLLFYFAMISVAIGFTNLLPIPPLDGHHLLILAIEGIRRKDLPDNFKHVVTAIGMFFILGLALLIIYFDIRRIFN